MSAFLLASVLLQGAAAQIPVQLGVSITPDTVTVGQQFDVRVRIRAPRGAVVEFPLPDSAAAEPLATAIIGPPATQSQQDSQFTHASAAYRLAAWDVGIQQLGIGNVVVRLGERTGYVSLAGRTAFVRSVLPADSAQRVPKPPRPAIDLAPFNWLPWLLAALGVIAAGLLWRLWIWYRSRARRPVDPFVAAERDFDRIERMHLVEAGEAERHAVLMTDVMRTYLAARVEGVSSSQTSAELLAASREVHGAAAGLGELLWRTDLVKFARLALDAEEGRRLGSVARSIVRSVEQHFTRRTEESERKAA